MRTWRWYIVRIELAAAIVALGAVVWFLVAPSSNTMGPVPRLLDQPVVWIGIAGALSGLTWMVRIFRADPEDHRSWWRFDRS